MGKTVNQGELAAIFGVTDVTIWEWQKDGLPMIARGAVGTANQYDTQGCIDWYVRRELKRAGVDNPREQLARLQVREKELDLAEREKVLVPVDQVEPVWRERVFSAAAFLQGEPSRLAAILESAPGIEAKRAVLRETFAGFLHALGVDGDAVQAKVGEFFAQLPAAASAELTMWLQEVPRREASLASETTA